MIWVWVHNIERCACHSLSLSVLFTGTWAVELPLVPRVGEEQGGGWKWRLEMHPFFFPFSARCSECGKIGFRFEWKFGGLQLQNYYYYFYQHKWDWTGRLPLQLLSASLSICLSSATKIAWALELFHSIITGADYYRATPNGWSELERAFVLENFSKFINWNLLWVNSNGSGATFATNPPIATIITFALVGQDGVVST